MSSKDNQKKTHLDITSKIGIFALSLLVTVCVAYLYSPVIKSHADTNEGNSTIEVGVGTVIGLNLSSNSISMSSSLNAFTHKAVTASVSTNSQYGYALTIEDADDNTNMTHSNTDIADVIAASSGEKTSSEMANNTWGYTTSSKYSGVPVSGSPAIVRRTLAPLVDSTEETTIDFGIKVGTLTSGVYRDTVLFTAYPNGPDDVPGGDEPEIVTDSCLKAYYVSNNILTDPRDGQTYSVKHLADGRCWMTENLRIADITISSANSNLPEGETFDIPESDIHDFTSDTGSAAVWVDNNPDYGGYYNYYTAVAGHNPSTNSVEDVEYSICPKGWQLPYGWSTVATGGSSFSALYLNYNENNNGEMVSGDPHYNVTNGSVIENGVRQSGGWANWSYFWTSASNGSQAIVNMVRQQGTQTGSGATTSNISKKYGINIRCVKDNSYNTN